MNKKDYPRPIKKKEDYLRIKFSTWYFWLFLIPKQTDMETIRPANPLHVPTTTRLHITSHTHHPITTIFIFYFLCHMSCQLSCHVCGYVIYSCLNTDSQCYDDVASHMGKLKKKKNSQKNFNIFLLYLYLFIFLKSFKIETHAKTSSWCPLCPTQSLSPHAFCIF